MVDFINLMALALLACLTLLAIWSRAFDDNLLQRVGLAVLCFGSAMRFFNLALGNDLPATRFAVVYGATIFAIGTFWKLWRNKRARNNRRKQDQT